MYGHHWLFCSLSMEFNLACISSDEFLDVRVYVEGKTTVILNKFLVNAIETELEGSVTVPLKFIV